VTLFYINCASRGLGIFKDFVEDIYNLAEMEKKKVYEVECAKDFLKKAMLKHENELRMKEAESVIKEYVPCLKGLTFGFVFDGEPNMELKDLVRRLQNLLKICGAEGCFYKKKNCPSFDEFQVMVEKENVEYRELKEKARVERSIEAEMKVRRIEVELMKQYYRDYLTTDPTEGTFELPDMKLFYHSRLFDRNFETVDSTLIEDTMHCSPEMCAKYPISAPSMFDVRGNKHREIVLFDDSRVYPEYAIVFYLYESEEEMLKNIPYEFPTNRHGTKDGAAYESAGTLDATDALYFIERDKGVGRPNDPRQPIVAEPDPLEAEPEGETKDYHPSGCFTFDFY